MALPMKSEKEIRKNDLKAAIRLLDKITDIETVKNNPDWFGRLNNIYNNMKISLGAILVEQELGKTK